MRALAPLAIGLGLTLGACSTPIIATSAICDVWRPIYPSRQDQLTSGTVRQVAENNAANEAWCGKRPPPKSPQNIAQVGK